MDEFRVTLQTLKIMGVLYGDLDGEHYGLSISKATGLKSGTLYPILARLEAHGLVTSCWEDVQASEAGRPARRFYSLSGNGIKLYEREARQITCGGFGQLRGNT